MTKKPIPEHLPIFVYGTLLPGHYNYNFLFAKTKPASEAKATLAHHTLWGTVRSAYPYLIQNQDIPHHIKDETVTRVGVTGALLRFAEKDWADIITKLDRLEGVDNDHYARKEVITDQGDRAWVYYAPRKLAQELLEYPFIRSGSWDQFTKERGD